MNQRVLQSENIFAVKTTICFSRLNDVISLSRDHDDDVSVAEACKKLNEISGFRGMGR